MVEGTVGVREAKERKRTFLCLGCVGEHPPGNLQRKHCRELINIEKAVRSR